MRRLRYPGPTRAATQIISSTNRTLSREQVFVTEGNSNSSPSGMVGDHQRGSTSCPNIG
jgi:hypothetical protein